jgi:predicted MFS family arabinose efflux permease
MSNIPTRQRDGTAGAARWGGVFALALGAFALVASEFMPVSLLTPVARALHVSDGQAGQAITISGLFALLTSLCVARLAGQLDRKLLLSGLTVLMIASGSVAAFAPTYSMFMLGRALIGVAIGGFWSMSAATAIRLVPTDHVPRALAIVNGGNALATVLAAPMASLLASWVGWRWAFFCVVPVAIFALAWKLASLPPMKPVSPVRSASVFGLLKERRVATGMAAVSLFFMGQFSLFTYLRPFLEQATGVNAATLTLVLLLIGIAGFVGTVLIGPFVKNGLERTLCVMPLIMAAIAFALPLTGASVWMTGALLIVWGFVGTAAPVAWWTWLAGTLPSDAEAGGGLMVAVVQLAIGGGAAVGGLLFDRFGYHATFATSGLLLTLAAALAWATAHAAFVNRSAEASYSASAT